MTKKAANDANFNVPENSSLAHRNVAVKNLNVKLRKSLDEIYSKLDVVEDLCGAVACSVHNYPTQDELVRDQRFTDLGQYAKSCAEIRSVGNMILALKGMVKDIYDDTFVD